MKQKGWHNESRRHGLASRGIRTKDSDKLNIKVWHKGELTTSYLILEHLVTQGSIAQKDLIYSPMSDSFVRLLHKGYIKRNKEFNPTTGRDILIVSITKKGYEEFKKAEQHWYDTIKPEVINK